MNSFRVGLGASLFAGLVALPASAAQAPGAAAPAPAAPAPAPAPAVTAAPAASPAPTGAAPAATPEGPAAGGTVSIGTEGAAANGSATGETKDTSNGVGMGGTKRASGDKCQNDTSKKWIRRCKPERNMFELGIFGGVMFPASGLLIAGQSVPGIPSTGDGTHELFNAQKQKDARAMGQEFWHPYRKVAPEIGLRFAWYPLSFLGGEIEGGAMPTKIVENGTPTDRAVLFNFRGHVIAQLPFWRIAPFVLVGGGMLGTTGALGNDIDPAVHYGGGVKLFLTHRVMMRLDIRDVVGAKKEVDASATHYPEILLGLSLTLNRPKAPQEVDKDSDGDGFLDKSDACPYEPGIAPDGCPERDRDGDGFMDSQDACPDVPGIAPDGCPEKDRDGDGFLDSVDKCPDDPGVEPDGCPIPDTDGDGILDPDDKCPTEPENKNGYQDEDGCPDVIPPKIAAFTGTIKGIYFDLDKDTIKPKSRPVLDRAVSVLQEFDSIRIEISGHTDSTGSPDYNRELSKRRANSVKRYLTEHGVDEKRIETRGAGPDEPIDTNKTAVGRAKNRRIEFTILIQ